MTVKISLKKNNWIFQVGPRFWPFVFQLTYPNIWTFWLGNSQQRWCIFHFDLGVSWYCVRCLSCASWYSCCDIHYICCRHLWRRWSLLCKYCVRSWIIFHNVASEWNSTFVFLFFDSNSEFLRWQMSINDAKCTVFALIPCFSDHLFFVSDFRRLSCRFLFLFSHTFPLLLLHDKICAKDYSGSMI